MFKHYDYDHARYTSAYFTNLLRNIYKCRVPFEVVVTDLRPKTKMGCYIVDKQRIRIHAGWLSDCPLEEIAIHEYAHHIHCTEMEGRGERPHGSQFWRIYSALMAKATQRGIFIDHYIEGIVKP